MRWVRRLLLAAVLVGTWWVGWQFVGHNQQAVSVHYVVGQFAEVPLWRALLASFATGAALMALFAFWNAARSGLVARRYRKALARLESEIHQLRNLPLAPDSDAPSEGMGAGSRARSAIGRET